MRQPNFDHDAKYSVGHDATSLFSQFDGLRASEVYREVVRDEAVLAAAARWPLLVEIQGLQDLLGEAQLP